MGVLKGSRRGVQAERRRHDLASGLVAQTYVQKVLSYGPIAYWPLWETAGAAAVDLVNSPAQDGAYTGVTLNSVIGPDGSPAGFWDGVNDYCDIYSVAFNTAFNRDTGSLVIWIDPTAASWTDATVRYIISLLIDGANWIDIRKNNANNQLRFTAFCGGGFNASLYGTTAGDRSDWICCGMTWNWGGVNTTIRWYINGGFGGTFDCAGRLVGNLAVPNTVIGAASTVPASAFEGNLALVPVFDRVLTDPEMLDLATV